MEQALWSASNGDLDCFSNLQKQAMSIARRARDSVAQRQVVEISAHILLGSGNYGGALRWFRKLLRIDPNSADGLWGLGACLLKLNRRNEARAPLIRSAELGCLAAREALQDLISG